MTPEEAPLDLDGLTELARRASDGPLAHTAFTLALNPSTVLRLIEAARLGVAWREAEEALPEGCRLYGLHKSNLGTKEQWVAACQDGGGWFNFYGPTPTAALQALAAKLREAADDPD